MLIPNGSPEIILTEEIVEWTKNYDPSRLVNPASGGNHYEVGDILDIHNYPDPVMVLFDSKRVNVLGEFGGIGLVLEDHLWEKDRNWGYVQYKSSAEATEAYIEMAEKLKELIPHGYSGAVYTQTTDVESEVNGLMTYDRKVIKLNEKIIRRWECGIRFIADVFNVLLNLRRGYHDLCNFNYKQVNLRIFVIS